MKELSLHVLDIAQNSIRAKASLIRITIDEDKLNNRYVLTIEDNGTGMPPETLTLLNKQVRLAQKINPDTAFQKPQKGGQGLLLLKLNTERANGNLKITSELNKGTKVVATFEFDHAERLPLGDIAGVVAMLAQMNPNLEFIYKHTTPKGEYCFDTQDIKEILDDLPIQNLSIHRHLKELMAENLKKIACDGI